MKSLISPLTILSLTVAVVVAHPVMAQTQLEEIVVTARQINENIQETPLTVNVMTEADIESAGITQTGDYLQLIPNVSLADSQTAGTAFLTIRGLSRVRNGELPVAVVVDGVTIINARQFTGQIFDTQQIEVVKGPQGALYGRNASNGAIVITTKSPNLEEHEGYIKVSYGTENEVGLEGSVSGPLSDNLGFRFSGRYVDRDGYFKNKTSGLDVDPLEDSTFRGRLMWQPSDSLQVDFKAEVSKTEGKGIGFHWPGGYSFYEDVLGIDLSPGLAELGVTLEQVANEGSDLTGVSYVANNPDRGKRDITGFSLKIKKDFGGMTLKSVTTYDELTVSSAADAGPYASSPNEGTQHSYVDVDGFSQELRLLSNTDGPINWQFGGYYLSWDRLRTTVNGTDLGQGIIRATTVPADENSINPTGIFSGDFLSYLEDSSDWALFGSVDWDLSDRLTLSLAGRYDEETREQNVNPYNTAGRIYSMADAQGIKQLYTGGGGVGCDATEPNHVENVNCGTYATFTDLTANTESSTLRYEREFSKFQPKVSFSYAVRDNVNVYGSWGIGYRAGQFNYPGISDISSTAREQTDQEENETIEIGIKAESNTMRFNAAYFSSKVDNTQYFPFDGEAFVQVFEDIDEAELDGIELELLWLATENLDLFAGYGSTNSEITKYAERKNTEGNDLPYVPDESFTLGGRLQWTMGNNLIAFARIDYEYRGEQVWSPENDAPRAALKLTNIRFGVERDAWNSSVYINNATDEEYNSEIVSGGFLHPAPSRVVRWDFKYNF